MDTFGLSDRFLDLRNRQDFPEPLLRCQINDMASYLNLISSNNLLATATYYSRIVVSPSDDRSKGVSQVIEAVIRSHLPNQRVAWTRL